MIVEPQRSAKASPADELPVQENVNTECGLSLWKQLVQALQDMPRSAQERHSIIPCQTTFLSALRGRVLG